MATDPAGWRTNLGQFLRSFGREYVLLLGSAGTTAFLTLVGLLRHETVLWATALGATILFLFVAAFKAWEREYVARIAATPPPPTLYRSAGYTPPRSAPPPWPWQRDAVIVVAIFVVAVGVYEWLTHRNATVVGGGGSPPPTHAPVKRASIVPVKHAPKRTVIAKHTSPPVAVAPAPQTPAPAPTVPEVTLEAMQVAQPKNTEHGLALFVNVHFRNGSVNGTTLHRSALLLGPNAPSADASLAAKVRRLAARAPMSPATAITPYGPHWFTVVANAPTHPAEWRAFVAGKRALYAAGTIILHGKNGGTSETQFCGVSYGEPGFMHLCDEPLRSEVAPNRSEVQPTTAATKPPTPTPTPQPTTRVSLHIIGFVVTPTPVEGGTVFATRVLLHNDGPGGRVTNVDATLVGEGMAHVPLVRRTARTMTDLAHAAHYDVPEHQDFSVNFNSALVNPATFQLYQSGAAPYYVDMLFYAKSPTGYSLTQEICIFKLATEAEFRFCPVDEGS